MMPAVRLGLVLALLGSSAWSGEEPKPPAEDNGTQAASPSKKEEGLQQRKKITAMIIRKLRLALESYRLDHGRYPWTIPPKVRPGETIDAAQVYAELRASPNSKINKATDYFMDQAKQYIKDGRVVDSWGNEIRFRVDNASLQVIIWSCGPDGKDDTNNGVSPDPATKPQGYYRFGKDDTGDDIVDL